MRWEGGQGKWGEGGWLGDATGVVDEGARGIMMAIMDCQSIGQRFPAEEGDAGHSLEKRELLYAFLE